MNGNETRTVEYSTELGTVGTLGTLGTFVTCCVTCRHIITSFSSRMLDGVSSMWASLEIKQVLVFLAGLLLSRLS